MVVHVCKLMVQSTGVGGVEVKKKQQRKKNPFHNGCYEIFRRSHLEYMQQAAEKM